MREIEDKIRKLIKLQKSAEKIGSMEEAMNAADKIQKLALKFNIDIFTLEEEEIKRQVAVTEVEIPLADLGYNKKQGTWIFTLLTAVGNYTFSKAVFLKTNSDNIRVCFHCFKHNAELVEHFAVYLTSTIRDLAHTEYKTGNSLFKRGKFYRQYLLGAALGVKSKINKILAEEIKEYKGTTALTLYSTKLLDEAMANKYPTITTKKRRVLRGSGTMAKGLEDGKNIALNTPIAKTQSKLN